MAKTAVAPLNSSTDQPQAPAAPAVEIEPKQVTIEAGLHRRDVIARAPRDMATEDLRSPKIWRRVQGSPMVSLRKLDRLLILAFDESWACEAYVKYANQTEAGLAITKIFGFRDADEKLYSDGVHEVYWSGSEYSVRRVADQVPVATQGFPTEGAAMSYLLALYPRKVS